MAEKLNTIKKSTIIKKLLAQRFKELNLNYSQISREADAFEITGIKSETLSRYFHNVTSGQLTEEAILFLTYRYSVYVELIVEPTIHDEAAAIETTERFFKRKPIKKLRKIKA